MKFQTFPGKNDISVDKIKLVSYLYLYKMPISWQLYPCPVPVLFVACPNK